MNLSPLWVTFFEAKNISATHWSSTGKATDLDIIIFEFAQNNNQIIFTNDLDFGAILAITNAKFPSVFQMKSQELMPDLIGELVISNLFKYNDILSEGALITFDSEKTRTRILPLKI